MNKKYLLGFVIGVVCIGLITAMVKNSGKARPENSTGKPQVVTSFYPLYYFASQIAGDMADVVNITPAGAEPHDYEPTSQEMARIEDSRMIILNGGGLEAWGDDVQKNIDPKQTLVITVGEDLATQKVLEEGKEITDPHVWLAPDLVGMMTDRIAEGLATIDPANADYYHNNNGALKAKLDALTAEYQEGLKNCASKNIITSHSAFGYLAMEFGLNQVSIAGLSPDAEPSPKQLGAISDFAKKNQVKYIFFEDLVSPKLSETIAREVGATTLVLHPIEGLGEVDIKEGKNYFTEMQENLKNLQIALQCIK